VTSNDGAKVRRQRRSVEEKRGLVALTRAPGATVARVARDHGVNANQLHGWRRLEEQGRLGAAAAGGTLLAVRVKAEETVEPRSRATAGGLWLELRRGSVRVENGADPVLLRLVLEQLAG
jgi:transposase